MALKDFKEIFVALFIINCCNAQLTFHNDPLSNSFTLKTPGLQQSFTRYFGGKQRANLFQTASAPLQQQPQQYQTQYQAQAQYQPQYRAPHQTQYQPQAQAQYQPQYQTQLQPQYQMRYQSQYQQPQLLRFSSSAQYNQPAQQSYPFEAAYEQPVQQSSPFQGAYPHQTSQYSSAYRGVEYPQQAQTAQPAIPSYAEQMQQGIESYQQEQQQMQQMLQQQQFHQQQLLMDLYKQPQGQGRAVTSNPGRSQPFYTADQYINFLNKQHHDVFQQQQNVSDRGYSFSPMSAYTNGLPATVSPSMPTSMNYSPSSNSSRVNYTNGKLSYEF